MSIDVSLCTGQVVRGPQFSEPMRVETVTPNGAETWTVGLVGQDSERFRRVTLTSADVAALTIADPARSYAGDGRLLRLGLQAYALGIAYEFDPYFGLSLSRVDPLPHQLEAVYDHLLKLPSVRFLLADDAGAGKTVMAGLLVRELKLRGLAERVLVVCPANLTFQWQRELKEKFDERFPVFKGSDLRDQFGVNQWLEQPQVITSLDLAKRTDVLPGLRQVHWDLVIVDEAHRMSARDETHKSQRYKLGEWLRDATDHLLLLTATPHKGDPHNFSLFLQLLDRDAYADVQSIRAAMDRRRAPFYLRRTKEAMVYFPERHADGRWGARPVFTKRIPRTVDFAIAGAELDLYQQVTRFVKRQSSRAAAHGDDRRARAVGFLMALYQRRLASSTYAMRRSLDNRAKRLQDGRAHAQAVAKTAPPALPDWDDLEEMEDADRARLEAVLEAVTLAGNAEEVRAEVAELRALAGRARAVEGPGHEAKLGRLENVMRQEGFFDRPDQRMGRIHRYGQRHDCLIFNFVATNTVEGKVLQRLLDKLQEIRDALDDDAVFNVVGEILPAAQIERVLRDYYEGKLGDADLEDRLLENVDETRFRNLCRTALEGLASKKLNLDMLVERRARAQERRVVPETIARFVREAARTAGLPLEPVAGLPHTFDPGRIPPGLHRYPHEPDWTLPALATGYPRLSTNRDTADRHHLEWVTPGHPLFEALRRDSRARSRDACAAGACFHSLQHAAPARLDFYRARIVDGLGRVVHERLFAVELADGSPPRLREPDVIGNLSPAAAPDVLPPAASLPEADAWLNEHALLPFLDEVRTERLTEIERIATHVEVSLTEILQRIDGEIGRAADEVARGITGAEGRQARAEARHDAVSVRRARRREEIERQRALTLQGVERLASALILPHPEREAPDVRRLRPDPATERTAMQVVMEHERAQGRRVYDVSEKNLGYDVTSLHLESGALRLIEVKGLAGAGGTILLTPNERRVAEDRHDCYWLYVVTDCAATPRLQEPIPDPARFPWHEVRKVQHYYLSVDALQQPLQVREATPPYGAKP